MPGTHKAIWGTLVTTAQALHEMAKCPCLPFSPLTSEVHSSFLVHQGESLFSASLYVEGEYIIYFLSLNSFESERGLWLTVIPRQKNRLDLSQENQDIESTNTWFLSHPGHSGNGPTSWFFTSPWVKTALSVPSLSSQASDLVSRAGWGGDPCGPLYCPPGSLQLPTQQGPLHRSSLPQDTPRPRWPK